MNFVVTNDMFNLVLPDLQETQPMLDAILVPFDGAMVDHVTRESLISVGDAHRFFIIYRPDYRDAQT